MIVQMTGAADSDVPDCWHQDLRKDWYFTREELERSSPSRKDGIDARKESQLRNSYCSFLWDVSIKLQLPQVTVATAIMYCHRFYLHQSHKKNEWQTVATACLFLASKAEESPCGLEKVVVAAYETMYRNKPDAARRIHQEAVLEKQKELIIIGERLLLSTLRFELNVDLPHKPLLDAVDKLKFSREDVSKVALRYCKYWLFSTLCVQYKPHYIAAGSLYLAAKSCNLQLSSRTGNIWWHEFEVSPQQLEVVKRHMIELLDCNGSQTNIAKQSVPALAAKTESSTSPDSVLAVPGISISSSTSNCHLEVSSNGHAKHNADELSRSPYTGERQEIVKVCLGPRCIEVDNVCPLTSFKQSETSGREVDQTTFFPSSLNIDRIRTLIKKRKNEKELNKCDAFVDDISVDSWIERQLEMDIEVESGPSAKKQKAGGALN